MEIGVVKVFYITIAKRFSKYHPLTSLYSPSVSVLEKKWKLQLLKVAILAIFDLCT